MGLDMTLSARQAAFNGLRGIDTEKIIKYLNENGFSIPDSSQFLVIEYEIGDWRKANQIHKWFIDQVDGVDNCQDITVSREDLLKLYKLCIAVAKNKNLALELLPPYQGFFFGSYEIDEWYMENILRTIAIIERAMATQAEFFTYQASW